MQNLLICLIITACTALSAADIHVAFMGDSITATTYLSEADRIDKVMHGLLKKKYSKQKIVTHNVSKGGSTVASFMKDGSTYTSKCLGKIKHIDVCFIQFGVNDESKYGPEEFTKQLTAMCDRLQKDFPGVHIVLCTSMGYKDANWWKMMGKDAEEPISRKHYNATRQLAEKRKLPIVDIYKRQIAERTKGNWDMQIRNQKLAKKHYGKAIIDASKDSERKDDGVKWFKDVHPNAAGIRMQAAAMMDTLSTVYPKSLPKAK